MQKHPIPALQEIEASNADQGRIAGRVYPVASATGKPNQYFFLSRIGDNQGVTPIGLPPVRGCKWKR